MPDLSNIQLGDVVAARSLIGIDVAVVVEILPVDEVHRAFGLRWDDCTYSVHDLTEGTWDLVIVNEHLLRQM